jgi:hypothetical protein
MMAVEILLWNFKLCEDRGFVLATEYSSFQHNIWLLDDSINIS